MSMPPLVQLVAVVHAQAVASGSAGGSGGIAGGSVRPHRCPQSAQSVPIGHVEYSEPAPPSSHTPFDGALGWPSLPYKSAHALVQTQAVAAIARSEATAAIAALGTRIGSPATPC